MSKMIKSIAVFGNSNYSIPEAFKKQAFLLGKMLAENSYSIVTGGSKRGLIKEVTDGYLNVASASNIIGVLPEVLREHNDLHEGISSDNIHWTETIYDRLQMFHNKVDTIIVLPGGLGTLHELMDCLVNNLFSISSKPIVLVNMFGFWNKQLEQFDDMVKNNALTTDHIKLLNVVNDAIEVINILKSEKGKLLEQRHY